MPRSLLMFTRITWITSDQLERTGDEVESPNLGGLSRSINKNEFQKQSMSIQTSPLQVGRKHKKTNKKGTWKIHQHTSTTSPPREAPALDGAVSTCGFRRSGFVHDRVAFRRSGKGSGSREAGVIGMAIGIGGIQHERSPLFFWFVTFLWLGEEDGKPIFSQGFLFLCVLPMCFSHLLVKRHPPLWRTGDSDGKEPQLVSSYIVRIVGH